MNPDDSTRFHGARSPESTELPEDFGERLALLKEASGLSWRGLARFLGIDPKQLRRWRNGTEPCGGAMLSLGRFARGLPGGLDILFDEDLPMTSGEHQHDEDEQEES